MRLGIDVGSTTVKLVLLNERDEILYQKYERHMSSVFDKVSELLTKMQEEIGDVNVKVVITGSGGLALADKIGAKFEQEVITCSLAVQKLIPQTDVVIELGGEDAKITYFGASVEQRMNGTCAGGTGAFIDQMAILLNTDGDGLNEAAKNYSVIYPIAARCGVFAKTDIQPLINEGAPIENLAASIFQAVVNQTISGLACGHKITGKVAFLGGPLTYLSELRKRFIETLQLAPDDVIFPENSKYFVAIGAAFMAADKEAVCLSDLIKKVNAVDPLADCVTKRVEPLFCDEAEYREFCERHAKAKIARRDLSACKGPLFLGIDAGSTTTKAALIDQNEKLVYSFYRNNEGNPLEATKQLLEELYQQMPEACYIANTTVTGYGEGLIKAGFNADYGIIETMAHYKAAEEFLPGVDFILDIGGQDIKVIRLDETGAVVNFVMNDKCAAGTGRFLEMMARTMEMSLDQMSVTGLHYKEDITISSMCTVFAESEVVSLIAQNKAPDDIVHGLNKAVAAKTAALAKRVGGEEKYMMTGGVSKNQGLVQTLEEKLHTKLVISEKAQLCGALGAALFAADMITE